MRIYRQGATVEVGTLRITYLSHQTGPLEVTGVRRDDFDRLVEVVKAYREITELEGELRAHPNAHARAQIRDFLGQLQPKFKAPVREPFPITSHTIRRSWRKNTVTPTATVELEPWKYASVELVNIVQVAIAN